MASEARYGSCFAIRAEGGRSGRGHQSLRARADRYGSHALREALVVAHAGVRRTFRFQQKARRMRRAFCCWLPSATRGRRASSRPGYPPCPGTRAGAGLGALRVAFWMSGVGADR